MEQSLGKKLAELRRARAMTQEEAAEKLGVSPQAVSKWENEASCPDILLLPALAELYEVTIDELFSRGKKPETLVLPPEQRKDFDRLLLRVCVDSARGDRVRVNLPMPLVKMGLEIGMKLPDIEGSDVLQQIDIGQIVELVEKGLIGKLVEVESEQGDTVEVVVE
ncbi:MAG: helix-turn-helix transcriptional regulator [Clostridiales bacterium]|nr:helix-turn-helix transcriptional regulator [Clostridiales bacterium]